MARAITGLEDLSQRQNQSLEAPQDTKIILTFFRRKMSIELTGQQSQMRVPRTPRQCRKDAMRKTIFPASVADIVRGHQMHDIRKLCRCVLDRLKILDNSLVSNLGLNESLVSRRGSSTAILDLDQCIRTRRA